MLFPKEIEGPEMSCKANDSISDRNGHMRGQQFDTGEVSG